MDLKNQLAVALEEELMIVGRLLIAATMFALAGAAEAADLKYKEGSGVTIVISLERGQTSVTKNMMDLPVDHEVTLFPARDLSGLGIYTTTFVMRRQDGTTVTELIPIGESKLTYGKRVDVRVDRRPIDAQYPGRGDVHIIVKK